MMRFAPTPFLFFMSLARMFIRILILTAAPKVAGNIHDISREFMQLMIEKPAVPQISRSIPEAIRKLFSQSTNNLHFTNVFDVTKTAQTSCRACGAEI